MLNTIAERLRYLRKLRKLSQTALAEASGVTMESIKKIEQGKVLNPTGLENIAKVLECKPGWLRYGESDDENMSEGDMEAMYAWQSLDKANQDFIRKFIIDFAKNNADDS